MDFVNENTISFKRLPYNSCKAYKIYVKEYTPDGTKEYFLDEIPNPALSLDIKEKVQLKYNKDLKWQLKDEISGVNSASIDVYINHNKLETKYYTFSVKNKLLMIHISIQENDLIEAEYCLDIIKYPHRVTNKCEYNIVPVFKRSNLIGSHNIL